MRLAHRVALVVLAAAWSAGARPVEEPLIAAASDLQFALREIAAAFTETSGDSVRLSFGSSGNLARQIRQGAPFELFLSADEGFVLDLFRDGFTRDGGTLYAMGRLAIFVPHGSPLAADGTLENLRAALASGRVVRFAIANPEHAPYGQRAEEVLRRAGLWDAIMPRLVLGENVSQAAQFATSANTQGGIVAYSLAISPKVASRGRFALIPADWYAPLRQRMALTNKAGADAQRFYAYLQQKGSRAVFRAHGFVLPDDETPPQHSAVR